jgi:S-adenosylmethionine decarboxylase
METDRTFAELAVGAGYELSNDLSSAMQPEEHEAIRVVDPHCTSSAEPKDYFVHRDGLCFAGTHLLIDLDGAEHLDDLEVVESALRRSAEIAGATILNVDLHHFEPNGGISGVVVLAESHISIHTWPERKFAALDIFMCGECDPYRAIPVLKEAFGPTAVQLTEQKRGLRL